MKTVDEIITKLRNALNADFINTDELENLVELLVANKDLSFKIMDFEYYNDEKHQHARNEKIESVNAQKFELAASWREKEKKISKYIEFRDEFNIKKSEFHFEEGFLIYFYFGTEKNDKQVKEIIKKKLKK